MKTPRSKPAPAWYDHEDFKKLQTEWYDKLKDDGFVDVERTDPTLQERDTMPFGRMQAEMSIKAGAHQRKAEFYLLAEGWLHRHRWRTRRERLIFLLYSEGIAIPEWYAGGRSDDRRRWKAVQDMLARNELDAAAEALEELES